MADNSETDPKNSEVASCDVSLPSDEFIEKFTRLLTQIQTPETNNPISIKLKLNDQNFPLWSRLTKTAIGGKGKLGHLTNDPPPARTPEFKRWEQSDLHICTSLLDAMEPKLVDRYASYPSAKAMWDGLAVTYNIGGDKLQMFDLSVRVNCHLKHQTSFEELYTTLQRICQDMDRRQPNLMKDVVDIAIFNQLRQETRLFQFLASINLEFDAVKRDLLKSDPLPSVEMAYATF